MKKNSVFLLVACLFALPMSVFAQGTMIYVGPDTQGDQAYGYLQRYCSNNGFTFKRVEPAKALSEDDKTMVADSAFFDAVKGDDVLAMWISVHAKADSVSKAEFKAALTDNPSLPIMTWNPYYCQLLGLTLENKKGMWSQKKHKLVLRQEAVDNGIITSITAGPVLVYDFSGELPNGTNDRNTVVIVDDGLNVAPGATRILNPTVGNDVTAEGSESDEPNAVRLASFCVETDSTLVAGEDGAERKANARRFVMYFTAWTTGGGACKYNENTDMIFMDAMNWLMSGDIIGEIPGTGEGGSSVGLVVPQVDYTINGNVITMNDDVKVAVYDAFGMLRYENVASTIDMNALENGFYIVKLNATDNQAVTVIKFMKR